MGYVVQDFKETCKACKPFHKYGTLRLVVEGTRVCSVCGIRIG